MHLRNSQATVSRMLKRTQEEGIVRTTIVVPSGIFAELEEGLRERFSLPEAKVVECSEDPDGAIIARIGEAAAHYFEVTLRNEEGIGVSNWCEAILKMVDNAHPMRSGKTRYVVQTLGGMGNRPRRRTQPSCNATGAIDRRRATLAQRAGCRPVKGNQACPGE